MHIFRLRSTHWATEHCTNDKIQTDIIPKTICLDIKIDIPHTIKWPEIVKKIYPLLTTNYNDHMENSWLIS